MFSKILSIKIQFSYLQAFISNLTLEDLYVNSYHNYQETVVTPGITATNTTAGRQLLNSIGREFPSIHSSLEIENTRRFLYFK